MAAIVAGVLSVVIVGLSLARLGKALRDVRSALNDLAQVTSAGRRVNGEVEAWRSATDQPRQY